MNKRQRELRLKEAQRLAFHTIYNNMPSEGLEMIIDVAKDILERRITGKKLNNLRKKSRRKPTKGIKLALYNPKRRK